MVNPRPRPSHQPIAVRCDSCSAPISLQDERASLVVCPRCDTHQKLTGANLAAIRPGPGRKLSFHLPVGASFRWQGARYEVAARQAWIEDDSTEYMTREYFLYHPHLPPLWLSEYKGSWDLFWKTHVQPERSVVGAGFHRGRALHTGDGKTWRFVEEGERELYAVEGALPWLAQVGERVSFAELSGPGRHRFEVERQGQEIECGVGVTLRPEEVEAAAGLTPGTANPKLAERLKVDREEGAPSEWGLSLWGLAVVSMVTLLMNIVLCATAASHGVNVFDTTIPISSLDQEILTSPFRLSGEKLAKVVVGAPDLSNAWMDVDLALVRGGETAIHVFDAELSYYHGVEGGESWSEGDSDRSFYIRSFVPGSYQLLLRAGGNFGESEAPGAPPSQITVRVVDGALDVKWSILGLIASGVVLITSMTILHKQNNPDEEDDD